MCRHVQIFIEGKDSVPCTTCKEDMMEEESPGELGWAQEGWVAEK